MTDIHAHTPLPMADAHLNRRSSVGKKCSTRSHVVSVTFDLGLGEQHQLNCSSEGPGKRHRTEDWGKYTEWHWYDRLQCFVTVIFYILTQSNKSPLHDVLDLMSCPFGLVIKPLAWTGDVKGNVSEGAVLLANCHCPHPHSVCVVTLPVSFKPYTLHCSLFTHHSIYTNIVKCVSVCVWERDILRWCINVSENQWGVCVRDKVVGSVWGCVFWWWLWIHV